jgi:hypothetical protein
MDSGEPTGERSNEQRSLHTGSVVNSWLLIRRDGRLHEGHGHSAQ